MLRVESALTNLEAVMQVRIVEAADSGCRVSRERHREVASRDGNDVS